MITVKEYSVKFNLSARTVRNYCALGKIEGAVLIGKTWFIPDDATLPSRVNAKLNKNYLLERLKEEKDHGIKGGIYHRLQIELTYNSNHIEGSKLSHDETRYIYETRTIGTKEESVSIDDLIETVNHFECIDRVIEMANYQLSESFIKKLHGILKSGTADSKLRWFAVGDYKKRPNEVGGKETVSPQEVSIEMKKLIDGYNSKERHTFEEIIEFHVRFERIHPFQDGNGRVGRLILLKECLKNNVVPVLIKDEYKMFYYRGLKEWDNERGYLLDTCRYGQDVVASYLDYFIIMHE